MRNRRHGETVAPDHRPLDEQPKWRRNFPIDIDEDNAVSRREFVKFLVLVSSAFVAGQFWIGLQTVLRRRRPEPGPRRIASVDEVAVGGAMSFSYPGENDRCLLVRTAADRFVAYDQQCTHLQCAVTPDVERGLLLCPCHNGSFDLSSGQPIQGPPRRALPRVALEVRDGAVFATGVETLR